MKYFATLILFFFFAQTFFAQAISGNVTDAENEAVVGATVLVKGSKIATITGINGSFSLSTAGLKSPFTLVVSMVGFETQEVAADNAGNVRIALETSIASLDQVVISASRVEERILKSPVTIEKIDALAVRNTPNLSFYDGLVNMKSLDVVTSSLTYKQINSRGFNDTGNTRFLQLVDGVDNQSAGLGFAVGNLFGAGDLDVESVELIPGAASALYGPVAFNGLLSVQTKNPFQHQGLSVQTKLGMNHFGDEGGAKPVYDVSARWAKVFGKRFALKLTGNYLQGTDWYANDYTDIDPGTPEAQRGANNPARNALNIYGDEVTRTIDSVGRISRTGYEEKDVAQYDVYGGKMSAALHYKVTDGLTAIVQINYGQGTTMYTGSSRYALNNFKLIQNRVELRAKNWFVRAYSTGERSTDSYNSRSLSQHINRTWVRDLNGNVVASNLADDTWFARYAAAFKGQISDVSGQSHEAARAFADMGRFVPGGVEFEREKDRLIKTTGLEGSGVLSNSTLYHADAQYDFSEKIKILGKKLIIIIK